MRLTPPPGYDTSFDQLVGLELVDADDDELRARVPVRDRLKQPFGLVHGGVYATIAESIASIGTWLKVSDDGKVALGASNHTSFLRPIREGTIHAVGRPRHRGRTTWVWDVEVTDDDGRTCAISRVRIAVRDAPGGAGDRDQSPAPEGDGAQPPQP